MLWLLLLLAHLCHPQRGGRQRRRGAVRLEPGPSWAGWGGRTARAHCPRPASRHDMESVPRPELLQLWVACDVALPIGQRERHALRAMGVVCAA